MIYREADPASSNAPVRTGEGSGASSSQSPQLIGQGRQDTDHPVPHHLGIPFDQDDPAAERLLESRVAALGDAALVVADGLGGREFDLLALTGG